MRRLFVVLTTLLALGFTSGCVLNVRSVEKGAKAADGSIYLGFDLVSGKKKNKDTNFVGGEHGKFSAVRLHVDRSPANIKRWTIIFGNGDKWNAPVKKRFKAGSWSRWVDLPGGKRKIRKIVTVASRASKKGRMPKLMYYGRR